VTAPDAVARLTERLRSVIGADKLITDPIELATYECDGLMQYRVVPALAVAVTTRDEVRTVIRECAAAQVPFVARGAGTGLSGGAVPHAQGVLVVLAKMRKMLELDVANQRAVLEPGVANLDVTRAAAAHGYYYAPDPSSQQICSIGGNVAENSGGAHCLKYGFTVNHAVGARVVLADGSVVDIGAHGGEADVPGYDLMGVFVGSEGLLGIATEVVVRILRKPQATRTIFGTFPSTDEAGAAVSAIISSGILPAAIEMCDQLAIEAIVAATGVDWPLDAGAALLMDVDGVSVEVEHTAEAAIGLMRAAGAIEIRAPRDDAERMLMWKGRKSAFAAMGRISPNYYVQDGVIPRKDIAAVLREIAQLGRDAGLRVANVFHAGDGNLHPLVLYDERVPGEEAKAERVGGEILRVCLKYGGSVTGEHGVGRDKICYLGEQFSSDDLDTMKLVRAAFDPAGVLNPDKVFPTPRLCGDRPGVYVPHAAELSGEAGRG
jgi:glycolate oxidase